MRTLNPKPIREASLGTPPYTTTLLSCPTSVTMGCTGHPFLFLPPSRTSVSSQCTPSGESGYQARGSTQLLLIVYQAGFGVAMVNLSDLIASSYFT